MEKEKNQAAVELGRKGGLVKSEKKAISSAENGKRGGRPKKQNDFECLVTKNGKQRKATMEPYNNITYKIYIEYPESKSKTPVRFQPTKKECQSSIPDMRYWLEKNGYEII